MLVTNRFQFIHHFAGPTWQHQDGSSVVGQLVKPRHRRPKSIPWLLLSKKTTTEGKFGNRLTRRRSSSASTRAAASLRRRRPAPPPRRAPRRRSPTPRTTSSGAGASRSAMIATGALEVYPGPERSGTPLTSAYALRRGRRKQAASHDEHRSRSAGEHRRGPSDRPAPRPSAPVRRVCRRACRDPRGGGRSAAILGWIADHAGEPEAAPVAAPAAGCTAAGFGGSAASRGPSRYILPAGALCRPPD